MAHCHSQQRGGGITIETVKLLFVKSYASPVEKIVTLENRHLADLLWANFKRVENSDSSQVKRKKILMHD